MKKNRYSEEQIIGFLKQAELDGKTQELEMHTLSGLLGEKVRLRPSHQPQGERNS